MEGGAGKGALLLLGREVSPLAAHILPAGGLAQGVVQGFDVVGSQLLHLHLPDIGDDEVLDERQIGLVGFGCPLVLAALLGQPVHQELCHRHRRRDQESASRQLIPTSRASNCSFCLVNWVISLKIRGGMCSRPV